MATDTQTATVLLDEATAIVEAEWMRLQQEEEDLWCEVADLFAEMPAPRPRPPRTGVTVQLQRPSRPARQSTALAPARLATTKDLG
jgi:hypothetical protein